MGLWFTQQEMQTPVEEGGLYRKDPNTGKATNRLELVKELRRLNPTIPLRIDPTGLSYAEFKSMCESFGISGGEVMLNGWQKEPDGTFYYQSGKKVCSELKNIDGNTYYFDRMYQLFIDISAKKYDNVSMDYLSMGMSADYEAAISCGANIVRLGTTLFGARRY